MTKPRTHCVMQIATVSTSLASMLYSQLRSLQEVGYQLVCVSAPGIGAERLDSVGLRHIAVPMTRRASTPHRDVEAFVQLYRVISAVSPVIVHTHTPKAGILGRIAARMAGVPVIIHTHHGFIFHERSPWWWRSLFISLEKVAAACCDRILSVSNADIDVFLNAGICRPGQIDLLSHGGNGIDLARFCPDLVQSIALARIRAELGIPDGVKVVGFVGRLVRDKGLIELFEAAKLIRERIPNVRFLVIGAVDTAKPDALQPSEAARYGVGDLFVFAGRRTDMPEMYSLMDVFALPSYREGLPLSPMEASAMGVPCVVTDIRGCREVVRPEQNGLLIPPRDSRSLAEAILRLLTTPERARQMGVQGRAMASERFDQRIVFAKLAEVYAQLLARKGLPIPSSCSPLRPAF